MLKRADWQALQVPKARKEIQLAFSFWSCVERND
jgi:hypothetical protein